MCLVPIWILLAMFRKVQGWSLFIERKASMSRKTIHLIKWTFCWFRCKFLFVNNTITFLLVFAPFLFVEHNLREEFFYYFVILFHISETQIWQLVKVFGGIRKFSEFELALGIRICIDFCVFDKRNINNNGNCVIIRMCKHTQSSNAHICQIVKWWNFQFL